MHRQTVPLRLASRCHDSVIGVDVGCASRGSDWLHSQPNPNQKRNNVMNRNKFRILQRCVAPVFLSVGLLLSGPAASAATINILGSTPPVPGADDQSQTNMPSGANQPPDLNYYFDNGNAPSQTFTTGNNPNG